MPHSGGCCMGSGAAPGWDERGKWLGASRKWVLLFPCPCGPGVSSCAAELAFRNWKCTLWQLLPTLPWRGATHVRCKHCTTCCLSVANSCNSCSTPFRTFQ